jgi:hypothetical protein
MREPFRLACAAAISLCAMAGAQAQTAFETIPFADGEFTITETEDLDKILAFNGKEVARNYVVFHDRTVDVAGIKVALFAVGDGGNACGPTTVIVWKPEGEDIKKATVGEDCGAPPAAVTADQIYFVPYVIPGTSEPVQAWSPETGVRVAGTLAFAPQPGTKWADLGESLQNISDALDNEEIHAAASGQLGDRMGEVVTGLMVGAEPQPIGDGILYGFGCTPHACGVADSFMAVDRKNKKLFFAHQGDKGVETWPAIADWPVELAAALKQAIPSAP